MSAAAAPGPAGTPEAPDRRRFRGNVGAASVDADLDHREAASSPPSIARAVAALRARLAGAGSIPSVPALLWLLPAIALQATLAAAWPAAGAAFEMTLAQALASFAAIVGGGWLIRAAATELDWNATPVCVEEAPRALVATGPYRTGRHPMYLGAALVLAGTALALGSMAAAAVAVAYFGWLDLRHARREDAAMQARFGAAWRAYAARTRRWF